MTLSLQAMSDADMRAFGRRLLYENRDCAKDLESAAQRCVHQLYETFVQINEAPAFVLVRIFRMGLHETLPQDLQPLPDPPVGLALIASAGQEAAWQQRQQSQAHQFVGLQGLEGSPMLAEAFRQLGFGWSDRDDEAPQIQVQQGEQTATRYFHIQQALDSPYIPHQEDFVIPYNIASVLGLGSRLVGGSAFLMVMFSRVPINAELARMLNLLTPFVGALLSTFEQQGRIWANPTPG